MNQSILAAFTLLLGLSACKNDPKTTNNAGSSGSSPNANTTVLAGHWIAMDFCSRANQYGSVLAAMNNAHVPYAYAFTFSPAKPDSVECFNGIEDYWLPVKFNVDTIEVMGARQGKSVFFVYDSQGDKSMTLFDATGPGSAQTDRFIKSKAGTQDGYTAFEVALNHHLFSGIFQLVGKGAKKTDKPIQFTPGGFIMNAGLPYDRYELCTAGDCFVTGSAIDVFTLSNSKKEGSEQFFGYRYNGQNDTLTIYNLINKNPDEKAAYAIGAIAYQLVRKGAQ